MTCYFVMPGQYRNTDNEMYGSVLPHNTQQNTGC